MIKFDLFTLEAFVSENKDFLINSRIQKIQQPTRKELILHLRNQGESRKFYVNTNPEFYHVCFMSKENEQKRLIEIPKAPPMFCMLLRKYLEGAKIAKVEQPKSERILEFYFEVYNEISEKIYLCLAIELMGKHSNVVLYNHDTNVIIGCLHNVGSDKSRQRELVGGLPYVYPPKSSGGKFLCLADNFDKKLSVNENIDNYFANLQGEKKFKTLKSKLFSYFNSDLKKINNSLLKQQKQISSDEKTQTYRKKADLIMSGLNEIKNKDFLTFIELIDWETNLPVKIELDKSLTLKENANRYYKLYNKAKTAHSKTEEMTAELKREKDYLEQVLYSVESVQNIDELLEIEEETEQKRGQEGKKAGGQEKKIFSPIYPLTLHSSPFTIYIGKNNKQNDYIVSKLAKDEDLWFHVKDCAGSHVLLKTEKQIPSDEIILKCAKLAKEYSSAKNSTKAAVIYTKAKYLKKPP
ncbi:MAG TPA: NFACT family protein, partial [Candidatus Gastranaerophilaceae bacterium]|nr:NFACT family protein [Candidatus Gastranaerophilaceae bacterium]